MALHAWHREFGDPSGESPSASTMGEPGELETGQRRPCNSKSEFSPEKPLVFMWLLKSLARRANLLTQHHHRNVSWELVVGSLTWPRRESHRAGKEKEVNHNPDRRRER